MKIFKMNLNFKNIVLLYAKIILLSLSIVTSVKLTNQNDSLNSEMELSLPPIPENMPTPDVALNMQNSNSQKQPQDLNEATDNFLSEIPGFIQKGDNSLEKEKMKAEEYFNKLKSAKEKRYSGKGYLDSLKVNGKTATTFPRFAQVKDTFDENPWQEYNNDQLGVSLLLI